MSAPVTLTLEDTPALARAMAPLRVGFTTTELRDHLAAIYPGQKTTATRASARGATVYVLSHPVAKPEGGASDIIAGCWTHKRFQVVPSRRSGNLWATEAWQWCPECIG